MSKKRVVRKAPKVRVWGYRDGTLLADGFEVEATYPDSRYMETPFGTLGGEFATVEALMALLNSVGIEACVGTDRKGEFNEGVTWGSS